MRPVIRDFFTGFGNIFRKPRTVVFPKEKIIIPENSRGIPRLHPEKQRPTVLLLCAFQCAAFAVSGS